MSWFNTFNPKVTKIWVGDILKFLTKEKNISIGKIFCKDMYYLKPENPSYIMKRVPSYNYSYVGENRDCDDFVRIFRGWLSQKAYGNLLAMYVSVTQLIDNRPSGHALIGFWHNNDLVFGEPQAGIILDKTSHIKTIDHIIL